MQVTNAHGPTPAQQLAAFQRDDGQPIYMLNLLKFRDRAVYPDGRETTLTGAQAYALYGRAVSKMIAEAGGKLVFSAQVRGLLIGEVEGPWDSVAVMMYPSFKAMAEILSSPGYAEIHVHRDAGLEGQVLIETVMG
ncbi:DUF1330 domain-containing protein [Caulobacter henricii]|uniref:DUF1330 domain-containing protein n=1 Tax=Caulobacter henricii TaxID=69395 RepID=A0A0P0NXQ1_9CAUL|nr:DUF1330 domain-containing protein [Caulobacter henricii]ALL12521.1 hypothetical protein AQ619_03660 [Caulobacter henricii]